MLDDSLLTVPEVAERLRLKPETVRRWIRSGKLRAISLGSDRAGLRVRASELALFLSGSRQLELSGEQGKLAA